MYIFSPSVRVTLQMITADCYRISTVLLGLMEVGNYLPRSFDGLVMCKTFLDAPGACPFLIPSNPHLTFFQTI
jgi:hypothetical protein